MLRNGRRVLVDAAKFCTKVRDSAKMSVSKEFIFKSGGECRYLERRYGIVLASVEQISDIWKWILKYFVDNRNKHFSRMQKIFDTYLESLLLVKNPKDLETLCSEIAIGKEKREEQGLVDDSFFWDCLIQALAANFICVNSTVVLVFGAAYEMFVTKATGAITTTYHSDDE
eukprot:TRINITY_DN2826_c0_g1_i4.p1 TRINITY_DN2826_c0_g1~~TRINITY_DN2826_c0_g1_i4.p1  ORF type:complete len:171 (+),score=14.93 TRINITY_DN2826_c0_g1_i4:428-940(+)